MLQIRAAPTGAQIRARGGAVWALAVADPNTGSRPTEPVTVNFKFIGPILQRKKQSHGAGPMN
jgi:hypothetical protein